MTSTIIDTTALVPIFRRYHVDSMSLFGSVVRGEDTPESDVDLLVSFSKPVGLLHLVALQRELTAALGRKVDLLTEAALSPYLRERILRERRQIYAA